MRQNPECRPQPTESKSCAFYATENCFKKCSGCKEVFYCSPECQKKHWKVHKQICKNSR